MTHVDWPALEHHHRYKFSRREVRRHGVIDSCWGHHYEVYVFDCKDTFCPVSWSVGVEDFWDRKTYDKETPD